MLPQLIEQYVGAGQMRIVWNDFAWYGDESRVAAQAARCAAREGLFWGYHDILYAHQRGINQRTVLLGQPQSDGRQSARIGA